MLYNRTTIIINPPYRKAVCDEKHVYRIVCRKETWWFRQYTNQLLTSLFSVTKNGFIVRRSSGSLHIDVIIACVYLDLYIPHKKSLPHFLPQYVHESSKSRSTTYFSVCTFFRIFTVLSLNPKLHCKHRVVNILNPCT